MRGSLEAGDQQFNIETDAEHIRAWVVSSSGGARPRRVRE